MRIVSRRRAEGARSRRRGDGRGGMRGRARAGGRAIAIAIVAWTSIGGGSRAMAATGTSVIDSVHGRARAVRVFAPRDEVSSNAGDAGWGDVDDGYEAYVDDDGGVDGGSGVGTTFGSSARTYATYDEYVQSEVARLELSLIETSGTEPDYEAIQRTLDEIAHDVQSDLDRIARTRATEMTYANDFSHPPRGGGGGGYVVAEPWPPADYGAYANEAYVIYDADGSRVMFEPQGEVGRLMQQLTWVTTIFPGNPTALDDYMRCSTIVRPCSVAELLRRCTYEPRGTWYRERISRMNAPLTWPYCQPDLEEVYKYCTEVEAQAGICDPRRARERMYLSRTIAINGGTAPCLRWRTNIFGTRECIDRG